MFYLDKTVKHILGYLTKQFTGILAVTYNKWPYIHRDTENIFT